MRIIDPDAAQPVDWRFKGVAPAHDGKPAADLSDADVHLFDDRLHFPVAVLRDDVVATNSRWMRDFIRLSGVAFAPHGKTTMAPELFRRQVEDGAWGITAATIGHVKAYRAFGVSRIFMANQLIGEGAIRWVVEALDADPAFELFVLADSVAGIEALAHVASARSARRPIRVLIEVGREGGRGGVRTQAQGLEVARAAQAAGPWVELCGVETFEGVFQMAADGGGQAQAMLDDVVSLAAALEREGLIGETFVLSAGGSAFYDLVAATFKAAGLARAPQVIVRSGCYLTHDDGMYRGLYEALVARSGKPAGLNYDLKPALQVWAHVQSNPEPGRWICGLGKRDVGQDAHMPELVGWARPGDAAPQDPPSGFKVTAMNDQHAFLDGPAEAPFRIGDFVGFGVSHPCTTFDKWRGLLRVDETWRIQGLVRTYF